MDGSTLLVESIGPDVHALVLVSVFIVIVLHQLVVFILVIVCVVDQDVIKVCRLVHYRHYLVDYSEVVVHNLQEGSEVFLNGLFYFRTYYVEVFLYQHEYSLVDVSKVIQRLFLEVLIHAEHQVRQTGDRTRKEDLVILSVVIREDDFLVQQEQLFVLLVGLLSCHIQQGRDSLQTLLPALH